nr:hypothetical protein [Tanacetum cinerariifolium]
MLVYQDEPASPQRDVSQREACPTDSDFIADQDRVTIDKSSTLPHDSAPRVTSPVAVEGNMQETIPELTALCTSLQRQLFELTDKFQAQEVEINRLKERVKQLEEREGVAATNSRDDAPIKGRSMDEGDAATERVSDETEEMATVLTSMDAAIVLASGVVDVPTGSGSIPTASTPAERSVPTGSEEVPTASLVFSTATVVTPVTRRKGKEVMVESKTPKKQKVQEQIDAQVTRELKEKLAREYQGRAKQIARDAEIARIHAEEELQIMISGLDRNNETIAKYLEEYQQFSSELPMERRIELISDLVKYQDNYTKIYKFQSQQRKSWTKKQKKDYYMAMIKNNLGWKVKYFRGMTFEEVEAKFNPKSSEDITEEAKSPEEVPEEKVKEIMNLVPIEEVYVEALQVKHSIIDWEETLSNRPPSSDKEIELWVELNRMFEPDKEDQLWTHTHNFMHAPVDWKLYDSCGVHHVAAKDKEIFMLVEKDYPLRKGLALVMICYKLQVENFSQMANELVLKIYKIANSLRQYALTAKPTVYVSHIRQFWSNGRIDTTEEGTKILATVDGIVRTVSESSLRKNLKLRDEAGISPLPDAELFENLTLMGYNISPNQNPSFSGRIVTLFDTMLIQQGEGSATPTEPHHTPFLEAQPSLHTYISSPTLPIVTHIPTVTLTDTPIIRQYTRRTRIAQSSVCPLVADEPASPLRDVSQGEACPTNSAFITDQDRATISKSSTLPHDSTPRVTFPAAVEGTQEVEINQLKEKVKLLEEKAGAAATNSGDDALIKGRSIDEGDAATKRVSDDTKEMETVLTSMDATTVLASRVVDVPTGNGSIPTTSTPAEGSVPIGSKEVPTASPVFATATVVARELEEQLAREDQRRAEQIARDAKIARIHAEEELQIMISGLDRNNETIAKYLKEYRQFSSELPMERRIELINDLVKDIRGMTFEEMEAKFNSVWKLMEDFIPMGSKEEAERIKRKGINLEQASTKKQKTLEEVTEEAQPPKEVLEEKRARGATGRSLVDWKLYDLCGVHHVTSKDKEIFMVVEKDYPLRKGLALVMICYKLQVKNFSQMANDLVLKIYKITNSPRQQGD